MSALVVVATAALGALTGAVAAESTNADDADRPARRELRGAIDAVRIASRALENARDCRACRGDGHLERRRRVGSRSTGGSLRAPVHQHVLEQCGVCDGHGFGSTERLLAHLERLHRAVVRLASTTPPPGLDTTLIDRRTDALADAQAALATLVERDADALGDRLVDDALRKLRRSTLMDPGDSSDVDEGKRGTVVAFVSDASRGVVRGHVVRVGGERVRIASTLWAAPVGPHPVGTVQDAQIVEGGVETQDEAPKDQGAAHDDVVDRPASSQQDSEQASAPRGRTSTGRPQSVRVFVVGRLGPPIVSDEGVLHIVEDAAVVRAERPDAR